MSFESIPSKALHFFDVPEVYSLVASFYYNFFTPDEKVDESGEEAVNGNLSERFLRKGTADRSNLNARIPRYVELSFSLGDTKKKTLSQKSKSSSLKASRKEIIDALNEGMFVTEDDVSSGRFKSQVVGNTSLGLDLENLMRATLNKYVSSADEVTIQDAITSLSKDTKVNSSMLSKKMVPPSLNTRPDNGKFPEFLPKEKNVKSPIQLNTSYAAAMMRKSVESGNALSQGTVMSKYFEYAEEGKEPTDFFVTDDEGVFDIPAADLYRQEEGVVIPESSVVGVLFEKNRIYKGKKYPMPAVLAVGTNPTSAYDSQVAYGQTYEYTAITLAKFKVPVTSDEGEVYVQTMFVASKPSAPVQVTITEDRAPEPPQDVNYYLEYEDNSLYITWAPPVNPQRDIKYIQVYRRRTLDEPFQLIANLDFDDSIVRTKAVENIDEGLTTSYVSMPTYYIDHEFDRESSYIYALVAVDARQLSSSYSTQLRVSFDIQKNKIRKQLVSYAGAPKQYPNWMVKENFFVDSMKDSSHEKVNIYFNPEAYTVVRGSGEEFPAFYSVNVDPLSKYIFQFINTDRLLERKLEVTIDDEIFRTTKSASEINEEDDDE